MKNSGGKKKRKTILLGVGLDSDGHKRLTTGPNFALVGGTDCVLHMDHANTLHPSAGVCKWKMD